MADTSRTVELTLTRIGISAHRVIAIDIHSLIENDRHIRQNTKWPTTFKRLKSRERRIGHKKE